MKKILNNILSQYDNKEVIVGWDENNRSIWKTINGKIDKNTVSIILGDFERKVHVLTNDEFNDVNFATSINLKEALMNGDQFLHFKEINNDDILCTYEFIENNAKSQNGNDESNWKPLADELWNGKWYDVKCISVANLIRAKFESKPLSDYKYKYFENMFQMPEDAHKLPNSFDMEISIGMFRTNLNKTSISNDEVNKIKLDSIADKFSKKIPESAKVIFEQESIKFEQINAYAITKNLDFFDGFEGLVINGMTTIGNVLWSCRDIFGTITLFRGIEEPRTTLSEETYWTYAKSEIMVDSYSRHYNPYFYENPIVERQYNSMGEDESWSYDNKSFEYQKRKFKQLIKNNFPLNLSASLLFGSRDFPTEEWPNMYIRSREVIRLINEEFRGNIDDDLPIWKEYINFYDLCTLEDFMWVSNVFFEGIDSSEMTLCTKGLKLLSSEIIYEQKNKELKRYGKKIDKLKTLLDNIESVKKLASEIIVGIENVANNLDSLSGVRVNEQYLASLKENFDSLFVEENGSFVISNNFKFLWPITTGAYENIFDLAISYEGGFYDNNVNKKELRTLMELYSIIDCAIYYYSV